MSIAQAAIFDVFGTVVDWRSSISNSVSTMFSSKGLDIDGNAFADHWRSLYVPSMTPIIEGQRSYQPLDQLHAENLRGSLQYFAVDAAFSDEECTALAKTWERLDPWPDSVSGLTRLKSKTIIAPCSNGSIALMTRLAKYGGLPWDCVLGAELAQSYKPDPSVYLACCKALRLAPENVLMVAAHNNDLHAAKAIGLKTAFVHRRTEHGPDQTEDLGPEDDWDLVLEDLLDPKLSMAFNETS